MPESTATTMRLRACVALIATGLSCCSPPAAPTAAESPAPIANATAEPALPTYRLAQPQIIMEADPPPPFTYWAREGATIRNHPHVPGIWLALVDDRNVASYYGDQCGASDYQRFINQRLDTIPSPPPGVEVRPSCRGCPVNGDMRANRMNLVFNDATRTVVEIACY